MPMKRLVLLPLAVLLAACGSSGGGSTTSTTSDAASTAAAAAPAATQRNDRDAVDRHDAPRRPRRPRPRPRAPPPRARPRAWPPTSRSRSWASRAAWATARSASCCATRAARAAAPTGIRACCSWTAAARRCRPSRTTPPATSSGAAPRTALVIAPGASASFRLDVGHGVATSNGCATAYGLQVIPPNDTATLRTRDPPGAVASAGRRLGVSLYVGPRLATLTWGRRRIIWRFGGVWTRLMPLPRPHVPPVRSWRGGGVSHAQPLANSTTYSPTRPLGP